MTWATPKTNWQVGDVIGDDDLNRIEGNLAETGPAKVQAAGDLVVGAGANALQRLAVGSEGAVLVVSGGLPAWGSVSSDEFLTMWGW